MLSTFDLPGTTTLRAGNADYDLHNCFEFVGYEHLPKQRKARFDWVRRECGEASDRLPARLALIFDGVSNFAVNRRDDAKPFTEDDCLGDISFLPEGLAEEFGAVCPGHRSADEHMSIHLMSGACVKIWAESVRHEVAV